MKRSMIAVLGFLIPALMPLSGCLEVHVRTTVSADGSSERVISMKRSSKELPAGAYPVAFDSTWSVEWKETGEKDDKFEYVARKTFKTPDDLQREYSSRPDTGAIGIQVSIDKKFEWFYTYLDYKEVYTKRNAIQDVPVIDYLTKDEIERYVRGEQSDSLKRKVEMWDMRNYFEEFYRSLFAEAQRRNDPALPASLLSEKKDELFAAIGAVDSVDKKKKENANSAGKKSGTSSAGSAEKEADVPGLVLRGCAEALHTKAVFALRPAADEAWITIQEKEGKSKHPDNWTCAVQMPGLLLESNSDKVEGNVITWKFSAGQIHVGDYSMHASSRVANIWAFVVTGIVALLVVIMAVLAVFRRPKVLLNDNTKSA